MDDGFKQRLVGALVLVAMAVVFLPMVLDGANGDAIKIYAVMPDAPRLESTAYLMTDTTGETRDIAASINAERAAEKALAAGDAAAEKPAEAIRGGTGEAWTVQVASFSNAENAEQLKQQLLDSGYNAYTRTSFEAGSSPSYRVFVGPELKRSRAEALQKAIKLDARFGLDGIVRVYKPV